MNSDREAQALDHLRVADKLIDYICQLSQMNSGFDKAVVSSAALRAKAALEQARRSLQE